MRPLQHVAIYTGAKVTKHTKKRYNVIYFDGEDNCKALISLCSCYGNGQHRPKVGESAIVQPQTSCLQIKRAELVNVAKNSLCFVNNRYDGLTDYPFMSGIVKESKEIVVTAERLVDDPFGQYLPCCNNCESFVNECRYGWRYTGQVNNLLIHMKSDCMNLRPSTNRSPLSRGCCARQCRVCGDIGHCLHFFAAANSLERKTTI